MLFVEYLILNSHIEVLKRSDKMDEAVNLVVDDDYFRLQIPKFLSHLQDYHARYAVAFKCLFKLQTMINNPAFRKPLRRLYEDALDGNIMDTVKVLLQIFTQVILHKLMPIERNP